jgi:hypothetical protein
MYTTGHAKAYHVGFFLLITILLSTQLSILSVRTGHRSSQHYDRLQCLILFRQKEKYAKRYSYTSLCFNFRAVNVLIMELHIPLRLTKQHTV